MVSREMLFTWSVLVTFLGLASAASIVSSGAIREGDSVIVRDSSENVTGRNVRNCTKSDFDEKISFNETVERNQKDKPILKSIENLSFVPLPISVISDSEIQIPVSIVFEPISKNVKQTSSRTKPEKQIGDENTKGDVFSISKELLPPKETSIYFTNITTLLEGGNYASITNTTHNIDSSETTSSHRLNHQSSFPTSKEINTNEFQKSVKQYDAITTIDETTFDKGSLDIDVSTDIRIQPYSGSHNNDTSSNLELNNTESIKASSVTTIQPNDKLYTNAPLAPYIITNAHANILRSDLQQPRAFEKMEIVMDSDTNNEETIQSNITEPNGIEHLHQNASKPCTPLDKKYPLTNVITSFDEYGPLNLKIETESVSANITTNNEPANNSMNIDTSHNSNEKAELFSEIITKTSTFLSNASADTATLSETYFSKMHSNETSDPLPILIGVNSSHSVPISIQNQQSLEYNAYEMQQSEIATGNAVTFNRNIGNYDLQSTDSSNYIITSTIKQDILSSISTIPTLYDSDILDTKFDGTTTEVDIPEPLILKADHKISDFLEYSILDGQDDLREIQYSSTTEVLLDTESTPVNIVQDAFTEYSISITDSITEQETEVNTFSSEAVDTSYLELNTSNEKTSNTTISLLPNTSTAVDTSYLELNTNNEETSTTTLSSLSNITAIDTSYLELNTSNEGTSTTTIASLLSTTTSVDTTYLELYTSNEETSTTTISSLSNTTAAVDTSYLELNTSNEGTSTTTIASLLSTTTSVDTTYLELYTSNEETSTTTISSLSNTTAAVDTSYLELNTSNEETSTTTEASLFSTTTTADTTYLELYTINEEMSTTTVSSLSSTKTAVDSSYLELYTSNEETSTTTLSSLTNATAAVDTIYLELNTSNEETSTTTAVDTSYLELNTSNEKTSATTLSLFSNGEQRESTGLIETLRNVNTGPTEDYEIFTGPSILEDKEKNVKPSSLNKCIFAQELINNSPVSVAATKVPENISTNIKNDKLNTATTPNSSTQNYMNKRDELWNINSNDPFLRKEPEIYSQLPIIITTQPNDQSTTSDLTKWHPKSTFSDQFISTTEPAFNKTTSNDVKYTTENIIEEVSSTFKIQTSTNTPKPNKLNVANPNEQNRIKNLYFPTVNSVRPDISIIPDRRDFMKTSYTPQQRDHLKIPLAILYDEATITKIPSKHKVATQRTFTEPKILSTESIDEGTKKHRYVANKKRGHIKYADTVTLSFYEAITSAPAARRFKTVRNLSNPAINQNTEKNNTQQNFVNKIQEKQYLLENITTESHQDPKIYINGIFEKSVHKKRRGNIRHRGYKYVTNTTRNIEQTVTNNQYIEESSKVKSDILNNSNDLKYRYNANETKQENKKPRVNSLKSSFNIPEGIVAINNHNKMFSIENSKQINKHKEIISQVTPQNHESNSMLNSLTNGEDLTSIPENTNSETLDQEEEFKIKTTIFETQMLTTLSPLTVRISKNAGFINNINLNEKNNIMNVKDVKDEIFQNNIKNNNYLKTDTTTAPALEENLHVSQQNKYEKLLENETNIDIGTKTYKLQATETANVNDKNHNNTKIISKQGNYFSSVYNDETLGKKFDVEITKNMNLEKQQDRIDSVNLEHIFNSSITSKAIPPITIGTESSTNDMITIQIELKTNSSVEDLVTTTQFKNLEEATTFESFPTDSTTSVPTIIRKRKRRPIIRKSIRKFNAVSADGLDNLEIRNDNTSRRIIRSTTTSNETHKLHTRMRDPVVPIINSENRVYAHTGHFAYSYESGDGTQVFETGDLKNTDETHTGEAVQGGFSYKDKEGQQFSLEYTADENGYRPRGAHLPTPPPIPPAIVRALEYLATKTSPEPPTTTQRAAKT